MSCDYCGAFEPIKPTRDQIDAYACVEEGAIHLELYVSVFDQCNAFHAWFPIEYCPMCGERLVEEC